MRVSTIVRTALFAIPLTLMTVLAPEASAQRPFPSGLFCPMTGGTCEAFPQEPGFRYAFSSKGNAIITTLTPETSPATIVRCIPLESKAGTVSVVITNPEGVRAIVSMSVCPGVRDGGGPVSPF